LSQVDFRAIVWWRKTLRFDTASYVRDSLGPKIQEIRHMEKNTAQALNARIGPVVPRTPGQWARTLWAPGLALVWLLASHSGLAHEPGVGQELILFGSADLSRTNPEALPAYSDESLTADILYSVSQSRFKLLAELLVSTEEVELERGQVGWLAHETTWIFAGRYHQPTNVWGSIYHHGQYLQTSITRPGIENWEDDFGVLQAHQTGLMLESNFDLHQEAGLEFAFSYGSGSHIGDGVLEPTDILDPDDRAGSSAAARIAFLPDALGNNKLGVLVGKSEYVSAGSQVIIPDLADVDQLVFGAFLNWTVGSVHLIGSAYHVQNDLNRASFGSSDEFTAGYVQIEKSLANWTLYGRWENTAGAQSSAYLSMFPEYVIQRSLLGVRLDFRKRHAITLEIFDAENRMENYRKIAIQWSAAFR
jgi:hypothetical protein